MKVLKRILLCLLIPALLLSAIVLVLGVINVKATWTSGFSPEGTTVLQNPERGWYRMLAYEIRDDKEYDWENYSDFEKLSKEGFSLRLMQVNIKAYRDGKISQSGLQSIRGLLQCYQKSRMKAILRFVYDWDGLGKETEPENLSVVLHHMEQLSSILRDYEDTLYVVQGVFLGSWGEMHTSRHLSSQENVRALTQKMYSVTGDTTFLSVRTPVYWRTITERKDPLTAGEAFSNSLPARLGLYNDSLLSSVSDGGTYAANPQLPAIEYTEPWGREAELDFQESLCRYVPNGGETSMLSDYSVMEQMLIDLPNMHVSYLSGEFSSEAHEQWEKSLYTGSGPFSGHSFREYLAAHLGYRYVVKDCSIRMRPLIHTDFTVEIKLENKGFAPLYYEKKVELLCIDQVAGTKYVLPMDVDIRQLDAGETQNLEITLDRKKLPKGTYQTYLKISEDSNSFAVAVANEGAFQSEYEANYLGTLQVD